jgi:hypothetical protein
MLKRRGHVKATSAWEYDQGARRKAFSEKEVMKAPE